MGSTFTYNQTVKDAFAEQLQPFRSEDVYVETVAHAKAGTELWTIRKLTHACGNVWYELNVVLITRTTSGGIKGVCTNGMGINAGPHYYGCPEKLLDEFLLLNNMRGLSGWAKNWLDSYYAHHAKIASLSTLRRGDPLILSVPCLDKDGIRTDETPVTFVERWKRGTQIVVRKPNGKLVRLELNWWRLPDAPFKPWH